MELEYDEASMQDWLMTSPDLEDVLSYAGIIGQDYWTRTVIRDTTENARSVHVESGVEGNHLAAYVVAYAAHAAFREYGTKWNAPERRMQEAATVIAAHFGGVA